MPPITHLSSSTSTSRCEHVSETYTTPLTVRVITTDEHRAWVKRHEGVSFLQLPEWGMVKRDWRAESLGWFLPDARGEELLVGTGLVLYRPVPRVPSRSLAYLPEGPCIDWLAERHPELTVEQWLQPLIEHCRARGAFQVKIGPPVSARRWDAETVKRLLAERADGAPSAASRIGDTLADWHDHRAAMAFDRLHAMGWRQGANGTGFGDVQPRYVFQLPLRGRSLDELWEGFNQLWRRNIRKAEKAGVVVRRGDASDLADFHAVYLETAHRDHFTPRPLSYFERMWAELNRHDEHLAIYIADVLDADGNDTHVGAAALMVTVGAHAWYSYGASTTADRDARPSNALQWRMITDAHAAGCHLYDLRGISDTLDPADPLIGLVQFKVGTGGRVNELLGEWDLVLRPLWAKAFAFYQSRRS